MTQSLARLASARGCPYLLFHLAQVEGPRRLARRKLLHGHEKLRRQLLDWHEHEHPIKEPVIVGVGVVLGLLERIAAQVEQQRHPELDEGFAPNAKLLA